MDGFERDRHRAPGGLRWVPCAMIVELVLVVAAACSSGEEKKPAAAGGAGARDAGANAAETAKRKPPEAGGSPAELAGRAFLDRWLKAQNEGDFAAYSALYAPSFQGVRRSGKSVKTFDRDGWMADRKRMFAEKMIVRADNPVVEPAAGGIQIEFEQTWESGTYADKGPKRIVLAGGLVVGEEMLASTLKVMAGATCADAVIADPAERKQVRDTQVFAPAGSKNHVCMIGHGEGDVLAYQVAVLGRAGNRVRVLGDLGSFTAGELQSDPTASHESAARFSGAEMTPTRSIMKARLVSISPAEEALLIDYEIRDEDDRSITKHALLRVRDRVEALVEVSASYWSSEETDEGTRASIEVEKKQTRGYFDVRVDVETVNNQWAADDPDDRESSSEESTVYRWDGSGYLAK